jgi:hypothetical protein
MKQRKEVIEKRIKKNTKKWGIHLIPNKYKELSYNSKKFRILYSCPVVEYDFTMEKLNVNRVISDTLTKKDVVLDLFAGFGMTTYVWALNAGKVEAVEKDPDIFECLKYNIPSAMPVNFYNMDNCILMKKWAMFDKRDFSNIKVVDLDSWNNIISQAPYTFKCIDKGLVLVTSGEHFALYRGTKFKRYNGLTKDIEKNPETAFYFGETVLFPWLKQFSDKEGKDIRIIHTLTSPRVTRLVIAVGGYKNISLERELSKRPKWYGWLGKRLNSPKKTLSDFNE